MAASPKDEVDISSSIQCSQSFDLPDEISSVLDPEELRKCLEVKDLSTVAPFETEESYHSFLHLRMNLKLLLACMTHSISAKLGGVNKEAQCSTTTKQIEDTEGLLKHVESVGAARLAATPKSGAGLKPRIERLMDKYGLQGRERDFFLACFVLQALKPMILECLLHMDQRCMLLAGMTKFECSQVMMAKEREHVKEGCLVSGKNMYGEQDRRFSFTKEALHMLIQGNKLPLSARLTISTTKMLQVLEEEEEGDKKRNSEGGGYVEALLKKKGAEDIVVPLEQAANVAGPKDVKVEDVMKELQQLAANDATLLVEGQKSQAEEKQAMAVGSEKSLSTQATSFEASADGEDENASPYKGNLDYLNDRFSLLTLQVQMSQKWKSDALKSAGGEDFMSMSRYYSRNQENTNASRKTEGQHRMTTARIETRLAASAAAQNGWKPRAQVLAEKLGLSPFEENVVMVLVAYQMSPLMKNVLQTVKTTKHEDIDVEMIVSIFCKTFEEQVMARAAFYKKSKLVQSGIIKMNASRGWGTDLGTTPVAIDRRTLDFVVGLDREIDELVEGSHLYWPTTDLSQVVLPKEKKEMLLNTIASFEAFAVKRKEVGIEDTIAYGAGLVILLFGPSGTGKTMSVNGLANHLKKRVLLVNLPSLGCAPDLGFRWLFREAKFNDAILFFDECESLFESREKGSRNVNVLLTEMERHNGIVFLATNRPYDLDEAMHRRITLVIEFQSPNHLMRADIWKALIPSKYPLAPGIDWDKISFKFELTGGFIKNAIISSLLIAIGRDKDNPVVTEEDLIEGCRLQLRGSLSMRSFDRRVVPKAGLDSMVLPPQLEKNLLEIAHFDKARQILFGQWGFNDQMRARQGITALFYGAPGTGKTQAAECLGFEIGKPIKFVNPADLLNKYVGETGKNIDKIFQEARMLDSILVFDEAEGLFGKRHLSDSSTARYANVDVGILLYHLEHFPGIVILITNSIANIDQAFFRRLKFVLEFQPPDKRQRSKLWMSMIPPQVPINGNIDFDHLGERYEFSGGCIASAVFRAAARVALRPSHSLQMEDLIQAAVEEENKQGTT